MASAEHRGKVPLCNFLIGLHHAEFADPPFARIGFRTGICRIGIEAKAFTEVACNARCVQCCIDPSRAITLARKRPRLHLGKDLIVNISGRDATIDNRFDRRSVVSVPASLIQFAAEIGRQFPTGRCISAYISKRERLKRRRVEWARSSFGTRRRARFNQSAVFLPQSNRNENMTFNRSVTVASGAMNLPDLDRAPIPVVSVPTPSDDGRARRFADFSTLSDALDFAAEGPCGLNFHDARGQLTRAYPYRELRSDARAMAARLADYGIRPHDRVALVAETGPEFAALFFGCIYMGAWPVPLPLPTSFGGRDAYVDQLAVQMKSAEPALLLHPAELVSMASDAARAAGVAALSWESLAARPAPVFVPHDAAPADIAYLQYSSGSTRFPHGVVITHRALLNNLAAHSHGMEVVPGDRCVSWLPWYHDMGLVGCLLSPVANQVSADYLKTEDFARRPLAWLDLISRNPGTTLSYSPTFGYDICARRISSQSHPATRFDLSRWRVAGNGADMIRPDVMQAFVDAFAPAGFKASSFLPSYGLAEATLAVSIMPPGEGIVVELVEETDLSGVAADGQRPRRYRAIVNCGRPARDMRIEIRDEDGALLPERTIGKIWCAGPSIMVGYFRDEVSTVACLKDGWLDTGDMGYVSEGYIYVVGRAKDMIIVNGKNHWPQDIEWAVEQLPGFKPGDIAAFAITLPGGEETPAVLVQCRTTDADERTRLRDAIREKVRGITGINCVIELVPPRTLPRTSSGKLSRAKARNLYLSGEIQPYSLAA